MSDIIRQPSARFGIQQVADGTWRVVADILAPGTSVPEIRASVAGLTREQAVQRCVELSDNFAKSMGMPMRSLGALA